MKKNWLKIGIVIGLVILFGVLLITVMSFRRDRENIDMNLDDPEEETIVFQNNSSMTEQEIRELVEEKRIDLKNFLKMLNTIHQVKYPEIIHQKMMPIILLLMIHS